MPVVTFHKGGAVYRGEVKAEANLVVQAGVRRFPFPHLAFKCGMGTCGTCACRVLAGGEGLAAPNWKEERVLGARLAEGWRLCCQVWVTGDIELAQ